jgi:hypothetical protein
LRITKIAATTARLITSTSVTLREVGLNSMPCLSAFSHRFHSVASSKPLADARGSESVSEPRP